MAWLYLYYIKMFSIADHYNKITGRKTHPSQEVGHQRTVWEQEPDSNSNLGESEGRTPRGHLLA